jgi:hypothetical protein
LEEGLAWPVVIGVKVPEKSMHHILVGAPGDTFHPDKGGH